MYFHENGKMLGTETVPYRQAATQPYRPQKPQTEEYYYIFKGWNNDLSHIEKDTMAKAVFEERQRSFVVRFFHENGTLLKEENVLYGQSQKFRQNSKMKYIIIYLMAGTIHLIILKKTQRFMLYFLLFIMNIR